MKKMLIWAGIIMLLFVFTVLSEEKVNETKLKEEYYDLIVVVSELFKDHTQTGEQYYNRSYKSETEMAELLDGKVTENGLHLVIDSLFEEYDDLFVYRQQYQEYLSDTLDFSLHQTKSNYYETVKNTILNPALRLIPFEQLNIDHQANSIVVEGEKIHVDFYDRDERHSQHHQYARYGFPPSDQISLSLTFIKEGENYLLHEFNVISHGM